MADNELIIKINGDVKNFEKALEAVSEKTADLSSQLASTAKTAAVAFAALTAEVFVSVNAFKESQKATDQLTTAMQNQGIYSKELLENYAEQADALQQLTGVSDEAVLTAQATIQSYLGQTEVTSELTMAIADLAAAKHMDLDATAQLIGKGINGQSAALKKLGIEIQDGVSKQEALSQVIQKVNEKFGGQAAASSAAEAPMKRFFENISNLQEEIGKRFSPAVDALFNGLNKIVVTIKNNKALTDFTVSMIAAGLAVSGVVGFVATLGLGFLKLKAALEAAKIATSAMSIATKGLVAATGLGLLVILVSEIYLNWQKVWPRMQAIFAAFVNNIGKLAGGLGDIFKGVFTMDSAKVQEGMDKVKNAFVQGYEDYGNTVQEKMKEQASEEEAIEQEKLDRNREAKKTAKEVDFEDRKAAYEEELAQNEEFQALSDEQKQMFREQNDEKNIQAQETETSAKRLYAQQQLQEQQKANQTYLIEQQKYGVAYATINRVMHSEVFQGTKQAFSEMQQMQTSQNATLKAIGKAAAVANIIIKTAESAMAIYAGFSTIPIVGPALGVAGAAAAIAFGGEQVGRVYAAADGGLMTGGIAGVDSIPVMAQRNELISPAQSFEDVIGSVRAAREAERFNERLGDPVTAGGGGSASVMIGFDGKEASQVLTVRQIEDRALGVSQEEES